MLPVTTPVGFYDNGMVVSDVSCAYEDVVFEQANVCTITNSPHAIEVTVNKDWIIESGGGPSVDPYYSLVLGCGTEIVGGTLLPSGSWELVLYDGTANGTSDRSYMAQVVPDWDGGTSCWVDETVNDGSIELDSECGTAAVPGMLVEIGGGDRCTVTNTVLFEGIPTLNRYGLAILAFFMLAGIFVGYRHYA